MSASRTSTGDNGQMWSNPASPHVFGPDDHVFVDTSDDEAPRTKKPSDDGDWNANLAESMDDGDLRRLGLALQDQIRSDIDSRSSLDAMLARGMKELGFDQSETSRSEPFPGASAVRHPALAQAMVNYTSRISKELFPAGGPVDAAFDGPSDPGIVAQQQRVRTYGNFLATRGMPGYRSGIDKLFMIQALCGTVVRKVYWGAYDRPQVDTIWPQDFCVPWSAQDLETTPRATHVMRLHAHEVRARMDSGQWLDIPLQEPGEDDRSRATEMSERIVGVQRPGDSDDDRYVIYEAHVRAFDAEEGFEAPYIVTVDSETGSILCISRNWDEGDDNREMKRHFVGYHFLPWMGFWSLGLYHMLGGMTHALTGTLRMMMDTGAINSFPGGIKAKGPRGGGNNIDVRPFTWTDVELPIGTRSIQDVFMPMPVNAPSGVMLQLYQALDASASQFASVSVQDLASASEQAPVGTALAIIEQQSITYSSIHARQHWSLSEEFELLRAVIYDYADDEIRILRGSQAVVANRDDFDGSVSMVPVSDPSVFSNIVPRLRAQALLQVSQQAQAAQVAHDPRPIYIRALTDFGFPDADRLLAPPPPPPQAAPPPPMDPVLEIQAILRGQPVKAYPGQLHPAHIAFLTAMKTDPGVVASTTGPNGAKGQALDSLIADHSAMDIADRFSGAMGQPLPQVGQPVPPQVEIAIAQKMAALAQQFAAERPPVGGPAAPAQDNTVQLAQIAKEAEAKNVAAQLKIAEIAQRKELALDGIAAKERIAVFTAATAPTPGGVSVDAAMAAAGIVLPGAVPGVGGVPPPAPPAAPAGGFPPGV